MSPPAWAPTEPGTCRTASKVAKSTKRLDFDVLVMRIRRDWINGSPDRETSGPQNFQIIGALDALLQSTLSGQTERVACRAASWRPNEPSIHCASVPGDSLQTAVSSTNCAAQAAAESGQWLAVRSLYQLAARAGGGATKPREVSCITR